MTRLDDSPVPDYANRLRLDGRRFVVIGSGQGIGRQAAHALAANGARLPTLIATVAVWAESAVPSYDR